MFQHSKTPLAYKIYADIILDYHATRFLYEQKPDTQIQTSTPAGHILIRLIKQKKQVQSN